MWAFEWHDTTKDLILRRGEPLFTVRFEGPDRGAGAARRGAKTRSWKAISPRSPA